MTDNQFSNAGISQKYEPLAYNVTEVETVDTVTAVFLGILAIILLIALLRSQLLVRSLMVKLSNQQEKD